MSQHAVVERQLEEQTILEATRVAQAFHQLAVASELIDGDPPAVRAYLRHFWSHWSGPGHRQPAADLDRDERISVDTVILWPEHDPLFPRVWGDCVTDLFSSATLRSLQGIGHFVPLEAPRAFAAAVLDAIAGVGLVVTADRILRQMEVGSAWSEASAEVARRKACTVT